MTRFTKWDGDFGVTSTSRESKKPVIEHYSCNQSIPPPGGKLNKKIAHYPSSMHVCTVRYQLPFKQPVSPTILPKLTGENRNEDLLDLYAEKIRWRLNWTSSSNWVLGILKFCNG